MQPFRVRTGQLATKSLVWVDLPDGHTVEVVHDTVSMGTVVQMIGKDGETFERVAKLGEGIDVPR